MNTYTVTLKPTDPKADLVFFSVDAAKAREIKERWDAHQNVQIGDSYISWQRIVEITAPPAHNALQGPSFCGDCESGWLVGSEGATPCVCSSKGTADMKEYLEYLNHQSWYVRELRAEDRRREFDSLSKPYVD